ncbi:MAG: hypothetical protein PHT07_09660 [Paludibacter sp.]|nr:hypothetical protein [Paludibacter sp.]
MTDRIIIKKEKGQTIALNVEQVDDNIVLTKFGDKTSELVKRKIIIETMDFEIYKKFQQIEEKQSLRVQVCEFLKSKI